ncbi:hypothetical protein B6D60_04850 [candidate division KSB1 bacterium 4484_87]|nr:MAG: hypothetical protein B6D60_04850 [candidate division KSB1 bacterium 4484_87]
MEKTTTLLKNLTKEIEKSEDEIISMAFRAGIKQLWREHILGRYLKGEISRDEAIEVVGIDWVEIAENQRNAVMEDLAWAMND